MKKEGFDQISEQLASGGENSRSRKSSNRMPRLHCFFLIGD